MSKKLFLLTTMIACASGQWCQAKVSTQSGPGCVRYSLGDESGFTQGCFDPCACPIWFTDDVGGSFVLSPLSITGTLDTYAVSDVHIQVGPPGGMTVTGSGIYTVFSEFAVTNRLELDLSINGEPPQHFDSGTVLGGQFPAINLTVSMNGMFCFDIVIDINASPIAKPLTADLNCDAVVDGVDLGALLVQWKTDGTADLNGDGIVDGTNLGILLAGWTD